MPPSVAALSACPTADHELVLDGTLEVAEGRDAADRLETFPRLRLDAPVCVTLAPLEGDGPVRVVAAELQLVGGRVLLSALRGASGLQVRVTGRPELGITAHHHTLLLLDVDSFAVDAEGPGAGLAGAWGVREARPGPISAWSDAEAAALVGRTVTVGADVIAPWTNCMATRWRRTQAEAGVGWEAQCADGTVVTLQPAPEGGWWTQWDGGGFRLGR